MSKFQEKLGNAIVAIDMLKKYGLDETRKKIGDRQNQDQM